MPEPRRKQFYLLHYKFTEVRDNIICFYNHHTFYKDRIINVWKEGINDLHLQCKEIQGNSTVQNQTEMVL